MKDIREKASRERMSKEEMFQETKERAVEWKEKAIETKGKAKEKIKGGIFGKIIKTILLPFVLALLVVGLITLIMVQDALMDAKQNEIESLAELTGSKVETFFTRYQEMARQMAANHALQHFFEDMPAGQAIGTAENYEEINETLVNSAKNDTENVLVTWIADFDASQFAESSGYTTEVGEWDVTTRSWYNQVNQAKDVVITDPYENSSTNSLVVSVISPVWSEDGQRILGVTGVDLTLDHVQEMVKGMNQEMITEMSIGDSGALLLVSGDGTVLSGPKESMIQKNITEIYDSSVAAKVTQGHSGVLSFQYQNTAFKGYVYSMESVGWNLLVVISNKDYEYDFYILKSIIFVVFMIAIAIMIVGNILVAKSIIKPITGLAETAGQIAEGHLDVKVNVAAQGETGLVAEALDKTVDRLKDYMIYIDEITMVLNQIAAGDLTFRLEQDYAGEFAKIKEALLNISETLTKTVQDITTAAVKVSTSSEQISNGAQSLSQGSTDQAASVEELQATITDISTKIDNNAQNALEANQKAAVLRQSIHQCSEQMSRMVEAMQNINQTSNEIGNIIATIESIASQTSMLSLNASIEAARAGEMGRGFAVVASQVGTLAGSSMDASKTSNQLIANSLSAVEKGMELTEQTNGLLQSVVDNIEEVAGAIGSISDASSEQALAVNQVMVGVEQISGVVEENSAMAQESSAAASELAQQAEVLKELIDVFQV